MDSIFVQKHIQKNFEDSVGVKPRNPPSGYATASTYGYVITSFILVVVISTDNNDEFDTVKVSA